MVGLLLDGRTRGPGARALAEDLARGLASDGIQTHRIELVPTPASSPRLLHSIRRPDAWLRRDGDTPPRRRADDEGLDAATLERCADQLAQQVAELAAREGLTSLHAIGLGLAARVAQRVHERTGVPYCVTPRPADAAGADSDEIERRRAAAQAARCVALFDEDLREPLRAGLLHGQEPAARLRLLRRGVDLGWFKPVPQPERPRAAALLDGDAILAARLQGIDWERACVVLCLQPAGAHGGFEQLLFALPQVLQQQPALQVIVVPTGDEHPAIDGLRAALTAGEPEMLYGLLQTNELFQPLVDHLEGLHAEGRTASWWAAAARLEPERRVRYTGPVSRAEFATLLALSDVFVLPGGTPRRASQTLYEALACGVLPIASENAGIGPLARLVAEEVSAEFAALCVLRADAPPVRELEDKLGRVVRLRPEVSDRLRALAVRKFDGRQTAADLRRLYGETARLTSWSG